MIHRNGPWIHPGTAVAGMIVGATPSIASEAMRRTPSISAAARRTMPSRRVASSISSRSGVPAGGSISS